MTFDSVSYFVFLPALYLLFYVSPERLRWLVLLAGSYIFYAAFLAPHLPSVLLAVTAISYFCGLRVSETTYEEARIRWVWAGILSCLVVLIVFKFLNTALSSTITTIGISYFTFQAISYLADIFFRTVEPERHFGHYALYLSFFPKLLQGPIERASVLMPQLKKGYSFDYHAMRSGLLLFTCGLFKKVVLADRLGLYAERLDHVHLYSGAPLMVGVYAYALQIYFDFAGYTDMARGSARLFGIELTDNFNSPYLATSIADFWRRWHITFSRWIFDYIFSPLHMTWRRRGTLGTSLALVVTFFASGLWHGTTWGFIAWGLLHGLYMVSSLYYRPLQKKLYQRLGVAKSNWIKYWQITVTFHLVCLGWIFFRTKSLADAWYVVRATCRFVIDTLLINKMELDLLSWTGDSNACCLVVALLAVLLAGTIRKDFYSRNVWFRWFSYNALLIAILLMGVTGKSSYIYFSF